MSEQIDNPIEWKPPENITEMEKRIVTLRTNCNDMRPAMEKSVELYGGLNQVPMEIVDVAYNQLKMSVDLSGSQGEAYPNLTAEDWAIIQKARTEKPN